MSCGGTFYGELSPGPTLYHAGGTSARWRFGIRTSQVGPALDLTDAQEVAFILKRLSTTPNTSAKFTKLLSDGGIVAADLALGLVDVPIEATDTTAADGAFPWFWLVLVTLADGSVLQPFRLSGSYRLDATVPSNCGDLVCADPTTGTVSAVALTPAPLPAYATVAYVDSSIAAAISDLAESILALTGLTGGSAGDLDAIATASGALASHAIREVLSGSVGGGDLSVSRWVLMAGTNPEDGISYIRPDDYNALTNARVWVRIG